VQPRSLASRDSEREMRRLGQYGSAHRASQTLPTPQDAVPDASARTRTGARGPELEVNTHVGVASSDSEREKRRLGRYGPALGLGARPRPYLHHRTGTRCLHADPYRRSRPRPGGQHACESRLERLRARNEAPESVRTDAGARIVSQTLPTPQDAVPGTSARTRTGARCPDLAVNTRVGVASSDSEREMRFLGRYGPAVGLGERPRPYLHHRIGPRGLRADPYRRSRPRPGGQHAFGSRLARLRARNEAPGSVRSGAGVHHTFQTLPTPQDWVPGVSARTRTGAHGPDLAVNTRLGVASRDSEREMRRLGRYGPALGLSARPSP
jgi:hypothetical protein